MEHSEYKEYYRKQVERFKNLGALQVICDESNNSDEDRRKGIVHVTVQLPIPADEIIFKPFTKDLGS